MAAATLATSTASSAARGRGLRGQVDRGGEAPGAVHHDAHRQAEVVAVEQGLQVAVGQPDLLAPDPLGAEVGVLGAQLGRALQRGVGQLAQRVGGELGVDPAVAACAAGPTGNLSRAPRPRHAAPAPVRPVRSPGPSLRRDRRR